MASAPKADSPRIDQVFMLRKCEKCQLAAIRHIVGANRAKQRFELVLAKSNRPAVVDDQKTVPKREEEVLYRNKIVRVEHTEWSAVNHHDHRHQLAFLWGLRPYKVAFCAIVKSDRLSGCRRDLGFELCIEVRIPRGGLDVNLFNETDVKIAVIHQLVELVF